MTAALDDIKISCLETGLGSKWYISVSFCKLLSALSISLKDTIAQDPETHGAMFIPIILGSDKTTVSVAMGHNEYYPLYVSIGNVHNNVRRAHRNAVVLVGFLTIAKSLFSLICFCHHSLMQNS